jgi:hypothetical protein
VIIVYIFQSCVSRGTTQAVILVVLPGGGKIKAVLVCTSSIFGRHARVPVLACVMHHQQMKEGYRSIFVLTKTTNAMKESQPDHVYLFSISVILRIFMASLNLVLCVMHSRPV